MKWTYLAIDFFSVMVPFAFSFHPGVKFYKSWSALLPAIIISGLLFLGWDAFFTKTGVWGFNEHYIIGIKLFNLPLEEVLFFVCIPYACIFSYHCMEKFMNLKLAVSAGKILTPVLIFGSVILTFVFHARAYTVTTFALLAILLMLIRYVLQVDWIGKFYLAYFILLVPFLIVNGLLTGTGLKAPIVWYNDAENLGTRIMTIPIEDVFYGMSLILTNLIIYKTLLKNNVSSMTIDN